MTSTRDQDRTTVLEISYSSTADREDGQGGESDKGDGDEEVDKDQDEEIEDS